MSLPRALPSRSDCGPPGLSKQLAIFADIVDRCSPCLRSGDSAVMRERNSYKDSLVLAVSRSLANQKALLLSSVRLSPVGDPELRCPAQSSSGLSMARQDYRGLDITVTFAEGDSTARLVALGQLMIKPPGRTRRSHSRCPRNAWRRSGDHNEHHYRRR
jgi:hypothetical protein